MPVRRPAVLPVTGFPVATPATAVSGAASAGAAASAAPGAGRHGLPARASCGLNRAARPLRGALAALAMAALGLALAGIPGEAAALFGDDEARKAIIDLRGRLDGLQQDMNRRFESVVEAQARLDRLEQAQRGSLDQQNQMEGLRQEIARLRGQLEEQANEIALLKRTQGEFGATVEGRLKQFAPVPMTIDGRTVEVDQAERRAYEAALDQFRASDFKAATAAFQAFQKQYADSPLMPLVLYWEGGARYASGDFKGAIGTLRQLQQRHPDSERLPDGLVILGNAQADSGDRKSARDTFRQIAEKYPDTSAAGTARERLAALK